eukprot:g6601.t1
MSARRNASRPYAQNKSYKFQKELGYEPRELTTASGWDKTKRFSNNPSWDNFSDEAVFKISPAVLNFGPILAEHKYRLKLMLFNTSNFTARARIKAFKPKHLCANEPCLYSVSKHAVTVAPGCSQYITVSLYGQELGSFSNNLEITTERNLYKIPIECEVMDDRDHQECIEWKKLNERAKNFPITMKESNNADEVELIEYGDEGVGVVYEGDSFANEISNAYLNAKWDAFSKRLIIDNREKWIVGVDESLNRKLLEQKYDKTFKSAKSKWTAFKDKFRTGRSARTMFTKVKQSNLAEAAADGTVDNGGDANNDIGDDVNNEGGGGETAAGAEVVKEQVQTNEEEDEKWIFSVDESLNRKLLEQKYDKTFKSAKSKWTAFKDKFRTGRSARTMFTKVKQSNLAEAAADGTVDNGGDANNDIGDDVNNEGGGGETAAGAEVVKEQVQTNEEEDGEGKVVG